MAAIDPVKVINQYTIPRKKGANNLQTLLTSMGINADNTSKHITDDEHSTGTPTDIYPKNFSNFTNPQSLQVDVQFKIGKSIETGKDVWANLNPNNNVNNVFFKDLDIEDNGGVQKLTLNLYDKNFTNLEELVRRSVASSQILLGTNPPETILSSLTEEQKAENEIKQKEADSEMEKAKDKLESYRALIGECKKEDGADVNRKKINKNICTNLRLNELYKCIIDNVGIVSKESIGFRSINDYSNDNENINKIEQLKSLLRSVEDLINEAESNKHTRTIDDAKKDITLLKNNLLINFYLANGMTITSGDADNFLNIKDHNIYLDLFNRGKGYIETENNVIGAGLMKPENVILFIGSYLFTHPKGAQLKNHIEENFRNYNDSVDKSKDEKISANKELFKININEVIRIDEKNCSIVINSDVMGEEYEVLKLDATNIKIVDSNLYNRGATHIESFTNLFSPDTGRVGDIKRAANDLCVGIRTLVLDARTNKKSSDASGKEHINRESRYLSFYTLNNKFFNSIKKFSADKEIFPPDKNAYFATSKAVNLNNKTGEFIFTEIANDPNNWKGGGDGIKPLGNYILETFVPNAANIFSQIIIDGFNKEWATTYTEQIKNIGTNGYVEKFMPYNIDETPGTVGSGYIAEIYTNYYKEPEIDKFRPIFESIIRLIEFVTMDLSLESIEEEAKRSKDSADAAYKNLMYNKAQGIEIKFTDVMPNSNLRLRLGYSDYNPTFTKNADGSENLEAKMWQDYYGSPLSDARWNEVKVDPNSTTDQTFGVNLNYDSFVAQRNQNVIRTPFFEYFITNVKSKVSSTGLSYTLEAFSLTNEIIAKYKLKENYMTLTGKPKTMLASLMNIFNNRLATQTSDKKPALVLAWGDPDYNIENVPTMWTKNIAEGTKITTDTETAIRDLNKSKFSADKANALDIKEIEMQLSMGGEDALYTNKYRSMQSLLNDFCAKFPPMVLDLNGDPIQNINSEGNPINERGVVITSEKSYTTKDSSGNYEKMNIESGIKRYNLTWACMPIPKSGNNRYEKAVIWFYYKKSRKFQYIRNYSWGNIDSSIVKSCEIENKSEFATMSSFTVYNEAYGGGTQDEKNKSAIKDISQYNMELTRNTIGEDLSNKGKALLVNKVIRSKPDNEKNAYWSTIYDMYANAVYQGSLTVVGDPSLFSGKNIVPYCYPIKINILTPSYDYRTGTETTKLNFMSGVYVITSIRHSINSSGYTTTLGVMRYSGLDKEVTGSDRYQQEKYQDQSGEKIVTLWEQRQNEVLKTETE